MCCRYAYKAGTLSEADLLADRTVSEVKTFTSGEIHPSDSAVIVRADPKDGALLADVMPWGFIGFRKDLLINARAETALEKKTFADSVLHRRCVIPASHFYEWDSKKVKNTFFLPKEETLFMAGFYNMFDNSDRFIILTTEANESMKPVHDRMPLILSKSRVRDWIFDDTCVKDLLKEKPPALERKPEYEQLAFFSY